MGNSQSPNAAIYLHGLDSSEPGSQELVNRAALERLATDLNLRIALPRATSLCGEMRCWGWQTDDSDARSAVRQIESAISSCALNGKKVGLIGFSNGGYMVAKLFRSNDFPTIGSGVSWGVAIGSGMLRGPLEYESKVVKGNLTIIVGTADKGNFDPIQNYFQRLRSRSPNVQLRTFSGGHELPYESLLEVAKEYVENGAR